jgi:hypothetical protein
LRIAQTRCEKNEYDAEDGPSHILNDTNGKLNSISEKFHIAERKSSHLSLVEITCFKRLLLPAAHLQQNRAQN